MTHYAAMLRAVNVGGTGKMPSADLRRIGEACGFGEVRTFIASGNLLFTSPEPEREVQQRLAAELERYAATRIGLFVRTRAEMEQIVADNPFADEAPDRVVAYFMDVAPDQAILEGARGVKEERMALGHREIYIAYGEGMANSRLKLPAAPEGTARNMNSVARIAALLA